MKFSTSTGALAVAIGLQNGLVAAAPHTKVIKIDLSEISVLGGMTFKIHQQPNKAFKGVRKGSLALARAYSKFGVEFPDDLLTAIEKLLEELGLAGNTTTGGNGTTTAGQGKSLFENRLQYQKLT